MKSVFSSIESYIWIYILKLYCCKGLITSLELSTLLKLIPEAALWLVLITTPTPQEQALLQRIAKQIHSKGTDWRQCNASVKKVFQMHILSPPECDQGSPMCKKGLWRLFTIAVWTVLASAGIHADYFWNCYILVMRGYLLFSHIVALDLIERTLRCCQCTDSINYYWRM